MPQDIPLRITRYLKNALKSNRLGHALLLLGPQFVNKELTALHIAAALLCKNKKPLATHLLGCHICIDCRQIFQKSHTNLHHIMSEAEELRRQPENNGKVATPSSEIRIDAIRALKHEQHMSNLNETSHIWIIIDGHHFTRQAANALLKTLEEPQNNHYFIILAPSLRSVLPTIASRCQRLLFPHIKASDSDTIFSQSAASFFEKIHQADPYGKLRIIEQLVKNKDTIDEQMTNLQVFMMQLIQASLQTSVPCGLNRRQLTSLVEALEKTQADMKAHINAQLALEHLFLQSWPQTS